MSKHFRLTMIADSFSPRTWMLTALAAIGFIVHGVQAGKLGLYWDDAYFFLHSLQIVDGDVMRFIFRDSSHLLFSERPVAYIPHMLSRASFAVSLAVAHWLLAICLVLSAVLLAVCAQELVDEAWFAFAVGVVFLTYPLSPLQTIWPATIHYLWAVMLATTAILLFLRGVKASENQRLRYFALAALSYLASILTHQVFILVPPIFVGIYSLSRSRQEGPDWRQLGVVRIYRPAVHCLIMLLIVMAAYTLWREVALPYYGYQMYSSSPVISSSESLALKFMTGLKIAIVPIDDVLRQLSEFPPSAVYLVISGSLTGAVWAIIQQLRATKAPQQRPKSLPWLRAFMCGAALTIVGIALLTLSPADLGRAAGKGLTSRVNFILIIGAALGWPALLGILTLYRRFALVGVWLSIAFLLYAGFTSSLLGVENLFYRSTFTTVLEGYSVRHKLMVLAYLIGILLLILVVIRESLLNLPWLKGLITGNRFNISAPKILNHFIAAAIASIVLLGSLFHFSVKGEYIDKWNQHKSMLGQLQTLAPSLRDNTFVVFLYNPSRVWSDPFVTHFEHSSFLEALYGNKTISGNSFSELRFHRDGAESTYYGNEVIWDHAEGASAAIPRIPYDRLLIFEVDGRGIRILPKLEVKTEQGESLVVLNNPGLILSTKPATTAAWRYVNLVDAIP